MERDQFQDSSITDYLWTPKHLRYMHTPFFPTTRLTIMMWDTFMAQIGYRHKLHPKAPLTVLKNITQSLSLSHWTRVGLDRLEHFLEDRYRVITFTELRRKWNVPVQDTFKYLQVRSILTSHALPPPTPTSTNNPLMSSLIMLRCRDTPNKPKALSICYRTWLAMQPDVPPLCKKQWEGDLAGGASREKSTAKFCNTQYGRSGAQPRLRMRERHPTADRAQTERPAGFLQYIYYSITYLLEAMSAAEEDTELRDLLIQTLENNGVLNKIKAELRASVFLALEEQEKVENKTPLVNENLKRFLNTRDGRLVASVFTEFLQFFNLDFTLAVFQPEACLGNIMDERSQLAKDLGIIESEGIKNGPLILELVKKCYQKEKIISSGEGDKLVSLPKELSPKQIAEAQKKFDFYDKDKNGEISKDELRTLFVDLFPHFHRSMLDRYVNDEFKAADKDFNNGIDFREFIGMYKRLFIHCRSVVAHDVSDIHSPRRTADGKTSIQGIVGKTDGTSEKNSSINKESMKLANQTTVNDGNAYSKLNNLPFEPIKRQTLELDEDSIEGDSFFDDPIPRPEKTYGCKNEQGKFDEQLSARSYSPPLILEKSSHSAALNSKESDREINLTSLKDIKTVGGKFASLELGGGNEDDYIDDFNSTSHRSDKSDVSIGEEIDEEDLSVDDLLGSDKLDDLTTDHTISQISDVADYLEEVS
ncbi:FGFR1 oncogene partner L homeolog isoform X3 [Pelobates cultripes]|uniref:FGFR1 oncogene partner L homeolog isoform X3 n=1 Tax=Pelobates cultripes TaxID=61616 RepID=A0AAD1REM5_PELCU|nr:FGFR1 oncogene partner L homeolog isoform X3 [Pelobates cultripes]